MLLLSPGGYPVFIDVPQASIDGAGTAMHFELPLRGHNFPLLHRHEEKLIVALKGRLTLKSGSRIIAVPAPGEAIILPRGTGHSILQDGAEPSTVGIALWPGKVEQAFRALAEEVAQRGFHKPAVIALLANHGVVWNDGVRGSDANQIPLPAVIPFSAALHQLPPRLAAALGKHWSQG